MSSTTFKSRQGLWQFRLKAIFACATALALFAVFPVWLAFWLAGDHQRLRPYFVGDRTISAVTVQKVPVEDLQDAFLFGGFDLSAVKEGERLVPPIFVRSLPPDWDSLATVDSRKSVFAKTVLPLILKENARIRAERKRLLALAESSGGDLATMSRWDRRWLASLARRYGLEEIDFEVLKRRVDEIPASLALVQAANESGWGSSRFAHDGNALFGQWTWNREEGIVPDQLQEGLGDYAVRRFDSMAESVAAYMRNLNTHRAYRGFRARRAAQRRADGALDGLALSVELTPYSQRGEDYVAELQSMIRQNGYRTLDSARLARSPFEPARVSGM